MKNFLSMTLVMLAACSSPPPEKPAPTEPETPRAIEISETMAAPLPIEKLEPQALKLELRYEKSLPPPYGSKEMITASLRRAMENSLYRGGIRVVDTAPNVMTLFVEDCKDKDLNIQCVKLALGLKTKRYSVEVGSSSGNGLTTQAGKTVAGSGDLSKAYQTALKSVIDLLPKQVKKMQAQLQASGKAL